MSGSRSRTPSLSRRGSRRKGIGRWWRSTARSFSGGSIHHSRMALQNLGVTFAIDRAGLVGADGPTHHGVFRPGLPRSGAGPDRNRAGVPRRSGKVLEEAVQSGVPYALRYPRGSGADDLEVPLESGLHWHSKPAEPKVLAIGVGPTGVRLRDAARTLDPSMKQISVVTVVTCKPLPPEADSALRGPIPTFRFFARRREPSSGGFWAVRFVAGVGPRAGETVFSGIEDRFVPHGSPAELEEQEGLSRAALSRSLARLSRKQNEKAD